MSGAVTGACLGAVAAGGVIIAVRYSPPLRRPTLAARIAPYLRDSLPPSRLLRVDPPRAFGAGRLLGAAVRRAAHRLDRVLGGTTSVRRRLEQSGSALTVEQLRVEQVLWAAAGLGLGLLLAAVAAAAGSVTSPLVFLLVATVLALGGALARDQWLTLEVRRRERRMMAEFPTVAEMLALAVAAGEGAAGALERVSRLSSGALATELGHALAIARTGTPLVVALEAMAARTRVPAVARFVDGLAIAIERGTPLADVLRAQAADVRDLGRRELLEAGGRREIAMLVPVVFLVLPVVVVFALYPGLVTLRLAVP